MFATPVLSDTERRACDFVALIERMFNQGTTRGEYHFRPLVDESFVEVFRRGRVRTQRDRVQIDVQFEPQMRNRSGVQLYSVVARWQPASAPTPVTRVAINAPAQRAAAPSSGALSEVGRSWLI